MSTFLGTCVSWEQQYSCSWVNLTQGMYSNANKPCLYISINPTLKDVTLIVYYGLYSKCRSLIYIQTLKWVNLTHNVAGGLIIVLLRGKRGKNVICNLTKYALAQLWHFVRLRLFSQHSTRTTLMKSAHWTLPFAVNSSFNEWMLTAALHVKSHKHIFGIKTRVTSAPVWKRPGEGGKFMPYSWKSCEC